jgi:hypothetical protein
MTKANKMLLLGLALGAAGTYVYYRASTAQP